MANNNSKTNKRIRRNSALGRLRNLLELLRVDVKISSTPEILKERIKYTEAQIKILESRV